MTPTPKTAEERKKLVDNCIVCNSEMLGAKKLCIYCIQKDIREEERSKWLVATQRMVNLRTCPDCGWIGLNTDHYCENCDRAITVSTCWDKESVKRLFDYLLQASVQDIVVQNTINCIPANNQTPFVEKSLPRCPKCNSSWIDTSHKNWHCDSCHWNYEAPSGERAGVVIPQMSTQQGSIPTEELPLPISSSDICICGNRRWYHEIKKKCTKFVRKQQ